jgi:hypothetical protein
LGKNKQIHTELWIRNNRTKRQNKSRNKRADTVKNNIGNIKSDKTKRKRQIHRQHQKDIQHDG